jgi:hypothetical protein
MAQLGNAIPIRWDREDTDHWFRDPASLAILDGSPVDCLIVRWATGRPEDAARQASLAPLVTAAHRRNLTVVGWVARGASPDSAIAAAKSADLDALAIEGFKRKSDFPVVPFSERAAIDWDSQSPVLGVSDNVWPGISRQSFGAEAGPTAAPWLDSNGWYVQVARARSEKPLWLLFDPPGKGNVTVAQSYVAAVCDSEAAGARWVISLDDSLRAGLAAGNSAARDTLQQIGAAAGFFRDHREWQGFRTLGVVGVISDFTGQNFEMSGEILNLMARRNLQFRAIWKSLAMEQQFAGLNTLVYADPAAPETGLRRKMMWVVEEGGLLVTGPQWKAEGKPVNPEFPTQFDVRLVGKGRLAVARKEFTDAYQIAVDTQFLTSHACDLMKVYNSSSSGCSVFTGSPDGKKAVLQILSYANARGSASRTVWVNRQFRSCRLWSLREGGPTVLAGSPSEEYFGFEYQIPPATAGYFALEFEV